jgi:hypothetical protein
MRRTREDELANEQPHNGAYRPDDGLDDDIYRHLSVAGWAGGS